MSSNIAIRVHQSWAIPLNPDIILLKDRRIIMLDFDEEIKKFQPSLEVEDAEDAIYNNDVPDITELITKIIDGKSER